MAIAASPTSGRYGNITWVNMTASAAFPGSAMKPGAITRRIHGAATMPSTVVTVSAMRASPSTARSMRRSSGRDLVAAYSVKTGIIAVERAPSARRRRRILGIRKATKNASVTGPAPNVRATSMSRANPSTRLSSVAAPIEPSAWTTCPSLALILIFRGRCGMMQRGVRFDSIESAVRAAGRRGAGAPPVEARL